MQLDKISQDIFNKGKELNFTDMELYREMSRSFTLRVFNQEIDHYGIEEQAGISFRGIREGKMGYAFSERLNKESLFKILNNARENAGIIEQKEGIIYDGQDSSDRDYQEIDSYSAKLNQITPSEKIDLIKQLEKEAFALDERVTAVNYCTYSDMENEQQLINSLGLDLEFKNNLAYMYLSVIAREGEEVRTGSHFAITQDFEEFSVKDIAGKAVKEAVSLFGATSLPSGHYPVILRHDVAASILATFSSTLSAERVQKGLSLLKGQKGEKVAADQVNLIDDPFLKGGFRTAPFDAEGVATFKKKMIENGRLNGYLHNLKTAKKAGVDSTGNAYRNSYKGFIDIAPTNMYIQPGNKSYQELLESLSEGVVIINVQGLHSGANPVSGDFSLGAYGYYVKHGEIVRPVEQITISGNFLELLQQIEEIGHDFALNLPQQGHFGSASLKISKLAVSGE